MQVAYSRGSKTTDNRPAQRVAENFDDFVEAVWEDKSPTKGLAYICAPMAEGLHSDPEKYKGTKTWRQKALAQARSWQPFDVDFLDGQDALAELLMILQPYRGLVYTTASSTEDAPRVRVILEADREMSYDESVRVGKTLEAMVVEKMGSRIKFDGSVYAGAQPCYTPTTNAKRYDLQGSPLDVDLLSVEVEVSKPEKERQEAPSGVLSDWMFNLLTGDDVHDGAMRLVGRLVHDGVPDDVIRMVFNLAGEQIANNRGDKRAWDLLQGGELKRLIDGARTKGFAPDKEPTEFVLKDVLSFVDEGFSDAWFVDEVIPKAGLGLIYGASGSGKSFLAIDLMVAIAQGERWRGRDTEKAKIVYIAAEGAIGVKKRFMAQQVKGRADLATLGIKIVDTAPNFLRDDDVTLAEAIIAAGGADIVVVDTLAQTLPGANENSSEDMGAALARCKRLHETTGAMVILVHHSGKDASKGARGWSGIKGALDVEIEVSMGAVVRTAKVTKLKDGEDMAAFHFTLESVELGKRANGNPITSCVVVPAEFTTDDSFKPKGEWQVAVWDLMNNFADAGVFKVEVEKVVDALKQTTPSTGKTDRRRDNIIRALKGIAKAGFYSLSETMVFNLRGDLSAGSENDDF